MDDRKITKQTLSLTPCSIGHPPHSSASPVELRLRVGPQGLSGKKKVRRYDRMEGVSERLGVFSESTSGSFLCEKGVSNGGTLRESLERRP